MKHTAFRLMSLVLVLCLDPFLFRADTTPVANQLAGAWAVEPRREPAGAAGATLETENLDLVGQIGGGTLAVARQGQYAYIGVGGRLVVLDISNPTLPTFVGESVVVPGTVYDLTVAGDYAYTAFGYAGLRIFDVSDPAAPVETGHAPAGWARGLALSGQYAYVADGGGLRIIDISDPSQPQQAGYFDGPAQANDVAVAGNYAYVSEYVSGLRSIDISVPSQPHQAGFLELPGWNWGVAVAGNYAYVSTAGTLQLVDVTDPAHLTAAGFFPTAAENATVVGNYAYIAARDNLEIVDVSDPANPTSASFLDIPWIATGVAVEEGLALVADERSVRVINVTNPAIPVEVGFYAYRGPRAPYGVAIQDSLVLVADEERGVITIDLRDPARPAEVGFCGGLAHALAVAGDYAVAVSPWEGLQVIDVSHPAGPIVVGQLPGVMGVDVAVAGTYAYVASAWYGGGLRIIDISNPMNPNEVGTFEVQSYPIGVAIQGNYAYLADESLRIIDVSNPHLPVQVGYYESPGQALDVVLEGDYAYLADRYEGMRVLNVSDPTNPFGIAWVDLDYAETIALSGSFVYIGNGYVLNAVDISDPFNPSLVASHALPHVISDVAAQGNYVLAANGLGGVLIFWFSGSGEPVYTVFGRVTDEDQNPMPDVVVSADRGGGDTTDVNGDYRIERLVAGDYTLTASNSGCLFSPTTRNVSVPPDAIGQDFSGRCRFDISGHVRDGSQVPFAGVEVSVGAGISSTTNTQGEYLFGDLQPGAYSIRPSLPGYVFWPEVRVVELPPDGVAQDFAILPGPQKLTLPAPDGASPEAYWIYTDTQGLPTSMHFPAGLVTETTTFALTPTLAVGEAGRTFVGHAFELEAYQDGQAQPGFRFSQPVTVTIHYSAPDVRVVSDPGELALSWWSVTGWADAADTCEPRSEYRHDQSQRIISVPICHLSRFGLFGPAETIYLPLITRGHTDA